jgi:hypothetical protein
LGTGFVGGMFAGGLSGQVNTLADHIIRRDPCKNLDINEMDDLADKMWKAGLWGAAGGIVGHSGSLVGKTFNLPGMGNLTARQAGAITGTAASVAASIGFN